MPDPTPTTLGALGSLIDEGVGQVRGALTEANLASRNRERDVSAALDAATQMVLEQRQGRVNLPLLAWASGMGQPTRAGSFAESMSQGLAQAGPALVAGRQLESEENKQLSGFQMARAELPHRGAMERLQMSGMPLDMVGKVAPTVIQMQELQALQDAMKQARAGGADSAGPPAVAPGNNGGNEPLVHPGFGPTLAQPGPVNPPGAPRTTPAAPPETGGAEAGDPRAAATLAEWVQMGNALLKTGVPKYMAMAQQYLARAEAAAKDGVIADRDGNIRVLPGAIRAQVARETALLRAKLQTELDLKPVEGVTPGGTKFEGTRDQLRTPPAGGPQEPPSEPKAPALPPSSAALQPVIPAAPKDGGWPRDPSVPPGTVVKGLSPQREELSKAAGKFEAEISDQANASSDILRNLQVMAHAYKQFTTGPYSEQRQALANLAETVGLKNLAEQVRQGDPAAAEMAKKNVLGLALKQLKEANSRFTQMEFLKISTEGSPSGEIRPAAVHGMLREAHASAMRDRDLAQAWAVAQREGWQNPLAFSDAWRKANPKSVYLQQADRALGNFKGMDLPNKQEDLVPGTVYVAPDKPMRSLADRGIKPGTMFVLDDKFEPKPFTQFKTP